MTTSTRDRILVAILFFILVLYFKKSCLNVPAFGDEINYLNGTLQVYNNNLNPFTPFWAYKPPLLYLLTALLYKIFGYSLAVSRVVILFFSFLTLYFTYLLAEKIYSKEVGFWAAILLFFSPFFFAQSGMFYSDSLIATFTVSTIYFFLKGDKLKYFISGAFLVMIKEITVLTIIGIGIYKLLTSLFELAVINQEASLFYKIRKAFLETLFLLSPLTVFITWMLFNKLFFGWYIYPVWGGLVHHFKIDMMLIKYIYITSLKVNFRYLLFLLIIASFILKREMLRQEIWLFVIIGIMGALGLAGLGFKGLGYGFSPRYMLFIQPLFFIISSASIIHLFKKRIFYVPICIVLVVLFIYSWTSPYIDSELNMDYLDIIKADKEAAVFLENNFPTATIIPIRWIFNEEMEDQKFGYVDKKLNCRTLTPLDQTKIIKGTVFVVSKFYSGWSTDAEKIGNIIASRKLKPLITFSSGIEKASIFIQN